MTSYSLEYTCIPFLYFKSVEKHPKVLWEHLRNIFCCIQADQELLGASGWIRVAVQNSWDFGLWFPNRFPLCWSSGPCHSCNSEMVRGFWVVLLRCCIVVFRRRFSLVFGNTVVGENWGTVLAALGEALCSGLVVVGLVEGTIDGTVICAVNDAVSLFLFEVDLVDTEMCTGVGDVIYRVSTWLPVIAIDEDDMDYLQYPNVDVCPAVSNWMMESRESRNVGV